MKNISIKNTYLVTLAITILLSACEKDNYTKPNASLHGKIIDANTGDIVPGSNSKGQYGRLFLYQLDYGSSNPNPIVSEFNSDGTYQNSNIFTGKYKVVPTAGPWDYTDTIITDVNGNTEKDIKLKPWLTSTITVGEITANSITVTFTIKNNFPASSSNKTARAGAIIDVNSGLNINDYLQRNIVNVESMDNGAIDAKTFTYTFTGLASNTTYYIKAGGRRTSPTYYNYSPVITVKTN